MTPEGFDPTRTYVHLPDGGAAHVVPVDDSFWPDLIRGRKTFPGRMVMAFHMTADMEHWERHPAGSEVLVLLSGDIEVILDSPGGPTSHPMAAGQVLVVPPGVWHRFKVHSPARLMTITAGEGTEHRG